jgi:hypothetical protein
MLRLKAAVAGVVELRLASWVKPLTVLKQTSLDPADIGNVLSTEPKCISHARGSLLRCSFGGGRDGKTDCHQYQDTADNRCPMSVHFHLLLLSCCGQRPIADEP